MFGRFKCSSSITGTSSQALARRRTSAVVRTVPPRLEARGTSELLQVFDGELVEMIDHKLRFDEFSGRIAMGDGNRPQAGAFGRDQPPVRVFDGSAFAWKKRGVASGLEEFEGFPIGCRVRFAGRRVAGGHHD